VVVGQERSGGRRELDRVSRSIGVQPLPGELLREFGLRHRAPECPSCLNLKWDAIVVPPPLPPASQLGRTEVDHARSTRSRINLQENEEIAAVVLTFEPERKIEAIRVAVLVDIDRRRGWGELKSSSEIGTSFFRDGYTRHREQLPFGKSSRTGFNKDLKGSKDGVANRLWQVVKMLLGQVFGHSVYFLPGIRVTVAGPYPSFANQAFASSVVVSAIAGDAPEARGACSATASSFPRSPRFREHVL
jgi:hypothetical protein